MGNPSDVFTRAQVMEIITKLSEEIGKAAKLCQDIGFPVTDAGEDLHTMQIGVDRAWMTVRNAPAPPKEPA